MRLLDPLLRRFGYVQEKAVGPGLLSAMSPGTTTSPRPTVHNMRDFLGRYADQAWVFSCIRIIQTKGAGVPLKIYKASAAGEMIEQPMHPLKKLLDGANPFMNGYDLREGTHGYKALVGNAYWLLDAFVNGKPTEIYPMNPARVKIRADKEKYITGYVYEPSPGVDPTPLDVSEVLHFKTWNPIDDFYGLPPLSAARDASDSLMGADRYNKMFFENSAEPSGILSSEAPMSDALFDRISTGWKKMHQGVRKAHKIAILEGGLKWQSVTQSHKDMQFPDLKRMSREDILTVYGIPPVMVGVFDEANYNNAQEQRRIFWIDTMIPELKKLESVINERLVKPYDPTVVALFDLADVEALQKDEKLRAEADKVLVDGGIMTINEVRKGRRLEDVTWGDTWHAPIGLAPVDEPKPEPVVTPPPTDNPDDNPQDQPEDPVQDAAPIIVDKGLTRREATWQLFKGATLSRERKWRSTLAGLFNQQERQVKRNLQDQWQQRAVQAKLDGGKTTKAAVDVIIFDGSEARKLFRKTGKQLLTYTLEQSAKDEAERYGFASFDITNPRVAKWLDEKAFKFADEVNSTTEELLHKELTDAIAAGDSVDTVAKRIEEVFDAARGYRSETIARTEVVSASNKGAFEMYAQAGVQQSEWITARDGEVRGDRKGDKFDHHIDGEVVNLGSKFSTGLEYPGDPSGDPGNVINCRCTIAPVVE